MTALNATRLAQRVAALLFIAFAHWMMCTRGTACGLRRSALRCTDQSRRTSIDRAFGGALAALGIIRATT
ncbi:MAG: hypothetical protein EA407_04660 [Rhodobacteraceae bacterium]|nr:MAG: hypothetical protein EA407_04660 [Paracoccaceae bacterium]